MRKFRLLRSHRFVGVVALSLLASCGGDAPPDGTPPNGTPPDDTPRDGARRSDGPEPGSPVRALSLVPSFAEIALAIGAADQLVARTDFDTDSAFRALPSVGGGLDPNLEAMVELGVGLVLMPEGRDMPAIARQFESLGIETMAFPTQSIGDLHTTIRRLGDVFGRRAAADSLSADIAASLDGVRQRVGDRPPVPVMYVVWSDPPMTTGGGTFIDEVIEIAGGSNVFADALLEWPTVGYEAIVERNPHYVLWPEGSVSSDNIDTLDQMAGWAEVPAIRERRVVFVDGDLFGRPGPSVVQAARSLASALHPDAF